MARPPFRLFDFGFNENIVRIGLRSGLDGLLILRNLIINMSTYSLIRLMVSEVGLRSDLIRAYSLRNLITK